MFARPVVLLLVAAPLFVLACSSAPEPAPAEPVATSSAALTGSEAVARADEWVAVKLQYCQAPNGGRDYDTACSTYCSRYKNPAWDPYRSDCSGLVSWAWGLPAPGHVTGQFAPFKTDISHEIAASELTAGDAVNNSEHVMLFKAWTVPGKTATFIEEPGCSSSTPYAHELTSNVTISGSSIHVAWNGMTFTAIRFTAMKPPNQAPRGDVDQAACAGLSGWAQDPDAPTAPLFVDLYFDAPAGKPGSGTLRTKASVHRADLCTAIGSCDHGFTQAVPVGLRDGKAHGVYAYGIDDSGGPNALLAGAPKSFTCAPPAMPMSAQAGIKRWVTAPASLAAWKLDPLLDIAHEPKATVDAYAKGPDLPKSPVVVIADDGAPEVWVIDGAARRHVVDAASLSAWQFAVAKWPAAKVNAMARGQDWPKTAFAFTAEGDAAVYVLDVVPPAPPPAEAGDAGAPVGIPATPPPVGAAPQDAPAAESSGCALSRTRSGGGSGEGLLLTALALAAMRRRRA